MHLLFTASSFLYILTFGKFRILFPFFTKCHDLIYKLITSAQKSIINYKILINISQYSR